MTPSGATGQGIRYASAEAWAPALLSGASEPPRLGPTSRARRRDIGTNAEDFNAAEAAGSGPYGVPRRSASCRGQRHGEEAARSMEWRRWAGSERWANGSKLYSQRPSGGAVERGAGKAHRRTGSHPKGEAPLVATGRPFVFRLHRGVYTPQFVHCASTARG